MNFAPLAYHLYNIKHNNKRYDCIVCAEDYYGDEELIDSTKIKLSDIDFFDNKMIIDYGSTTTFIITYLESRNLEKGNGRHYPSIIEGAGRGMLDDISGDELKVKSVYPVEIGK